MGEDENVGGIVAVVAGVCEEATRPRDDELREERSWRALEEQKVQCRRIERRVRQWVEQRKRGLCIGSWRTQQGERQLHEVTIDRAARNIATTIKWQHGRSTRADVLR